jgi:hypothetical protein
MSKQELRNFGFMIAAFVATVFGLLLPWLFTHAAPTWPWIVSGVFSFFALLLPSLLLPIYKGWMVIGNVLGWVNTRIILGILFYVLFFPIGLGMKLLGKDPMARKINRTKDTSYRISCSRKNIELMEKPY